MYLCMCVAFPPSLGGVWKQYLFLMHACICLISWKTAVGTANVNNCPYKPLPVSTSCSFSELPQLARAVVLTGDADVSTAKAPFYFTCIFSEL